MNITVHARARLQQRAIPSIIVDLLETFGSGQRCGGQKDSSSTSLHANA